MRVPVEDGEAMLASLICFNADAVAAILALSKGDACAIAGRAKLSEWEKNGETHHGLSVVADKVLTVYAAGKARKSARDAEESPA
jgi:single-stranded DNA-binding protein